MILRLYVCVLVVFPGCDRPYVCMCARACRSGIAYLTMLATSSSVQGGQCFDKMVYVNISYSLLGYHDGCPDFDSGHENQVRAKRARRF